MSDETNWIMLKWANVKIEKVENNNLQTKQIATKDVDFSKTNIQKENVDEPEILKVNSKNIIYFDKKLWKIFIINSPVLFNKIDLDNVKITDTIKIPKVINKHSVKLFFVNNQLIVIWNRYSKKFWWLVTDLVFYKIENWKAKFLRLYDVKWRFKDARIVNNKIYLITDYNFWNVVRKICDKYVYQPIKKDLQILRDNLYKKELDFKEFNEKAKKLYSWQIEKIKNKKELLNDIKNKIKIKNINIYYLKDWKLNVNWKKLPLWVNLIKTDVKNILFLPTKFDKININNLHFNLINIVDLDNKNKSTQYSIFWNISNWQIHMTTKSLYLINNYFENYNWRCPIWMYCILPYYPRWNFTLIHKFWLNWFNLNYVNSQIIPWRPINQYSMDEDNLWNFKIFTKHFYPKKTDLYIFDSGLKLVGKLANIAPWENFKSSRFLEDKVFLVTFKATDPLFVIDLKDIKNPKIIWELKIPWYSLYLHPINFSWNVQYLLWIGQEAKEIYWN